MEMIVCLLLFALSAAVCAQMFAKSHKISHTAIDENHAVIAVSNIAECFYAEFGDTNQISEKFFKQNSAITDDGALRVYYDEAFESSSDKENAPYYAELKIIGTNENLCEGVISFFSRTKKEGKITIEPVYSLDVTVNIPNRK